MGPRKRRVKKEHRGTGGRGRQPESSRASYLVNSFKLYIIVFIASTCGLVIEIVAARILAPSIGVSLYTWTSIIGVVLAGISAGNYIGGRLADRFPSPTTLGFILLASGIFTLSVLPLVEPVSEALHTLPLVQRIVLVTATLFFLPSLILGMVTPVAIKLRLRDLSSTGNVVGKIYALSTAGSIFGTFITGFVLIQWIGTRVIILCVAIMLLFLALIFGNLWRAKVPAIACLVGFLCISGLTVANRALDSGALRESNYFSIRVDDAVQNGHHVKVLSLDALVHSYVDLEDPTFLMYNCEKIFAEIATYMVQGNPNPRILFIGGGGYTMSRYIEKTYPGSILEVIEIDPEVTRVAFDYLGLPRDTGITTYNEDARTAVLKLPEHQYDLIIGDAFNDLSVPYHLTTHEFNEQIRLLLKDNGLYAVNVVDKLNSGRFLIAFVNTLQLTFPYVYVICDSPKWEDDSISPHVVVGSFQPLSSAALSQANAQAGKLSLVSHILPEDTLISLLNVRRNILLTDDYAPVDNLMAPLQLEKYDPAEAYYQRGNAYGAEGEYDLAIADFTKAIEIHPDFAKAYSERGLVYIRKGEYDLAIADYTKAIEIDPKDASAYNSRGVAYGYKSEYDLAIADYTKAIEIDSHSAEAYYNRGFAYKAQGRKGDAIADFVKFIALNDNQQWIQIAEQEIDELKK